MKNKLAYHRMKKTAIETKRDMTSLIQDSIDNYNARGESIYGDQWQSGEVPLRYKYYSFHNFISSMTDSYYAVEISWHYPIKKYRKFKSKRRT